MDDELLKALKEQFQKDMTGTFIPNKDKRKLVEDVYTALQSNLKYSVMKMRVDEPFIGSIDILISGKEIRSLNPKVFGQMLALSDVAEIVTTKNGIQLNLTFYGTSQKVGD